MLRAITLISLAASVSAMASPLRVGIAHPGVPNAWTDLGRAEPTSLVTLIVAVAQNPDGKVKLERELLKRSDPDNRAWYSQWIAQKEVDTLLAPSADAVTAVRSWLESAGGVVEGTANSDWLQAHSP
jgi:hypothetical protein